jgi:hypothetical protein
MLSLYDKRHVDIVAKVEKEPFKAALEALAPELRQGLRKAGLQPGHLRFEMQGASPTGGYASKPSDYGSGFEVRA